MKLSLQVCEPCVLCSLQEHSLSWIWAHRRRMVQSLGTYPKHECLRRCPKLVCAPFLANRQSLLIVPRSPDTYKTLWAVRNLICTFELSLLWRLLNFSSQSVIFPPTKHRVALDWLHEVLCCDESKHRNTQRERRKQRWYSQMEDRSINPQCLRMKGKLSRNAAELFHCPRQASTRLTGVWYSISLRLTNWRLTALKLFPQLSLLSHWFLAVVNPN